MRQLTEDEFKVVLTKLANYTGRSLTNLIAPPAATKAPEASTSSTSGSKTRASDPNSQRGVFRLHRNRIYYVPLFIERLATTVARDQLLSLGTCIGKLTKSGKCRLTITALPILAPHARYKVWIKPNGEGPFTYGGHILKAHVGRWNEEVPEHQGVIVYNMNDVPLGFGVTSRSVVDLKRADQTTIAVFRQADVGEYLREEDSLFTPTN